MDFIMCFLSFLFQRHCHTSPLSNTLISVVCLQPQTMVTDPGRGVRQRTDNNMYTVVQLILKIIALFSYRNWINLVFVYFANCLMQTVLHEFKEFYARSEIILHSMFYMYVLVTM